VCENVELEFTKRFLTLLASFYETPSMEVILTFPPAPPSEHEQKIVKAPPFHSGIWDAKLRDEIDGHAVAPSELSEPPAAESDVSYSPKWGKIREIPAYIRNLQKEREMVNKRSKPHREDLENLGKIFAERVKRQRDLAQKRAIQRCSHLEEVKRQHRQFLKTLPQSPRPADLDLKQMAKARESARIEERNAIAQKRADAFEEEARIVARFGSSPRKPLRSERNE
jgi:hypothetical protein